MQLPACLLQSSYSKQLQHTQQHGNSPPNNKKHSVHAHALAGDHARTISVEPSRTRSVFRSAHATSAPSGDQCTWPPLCASPTPSVSPRPPAPRPPAIVTSIVDIPAQQEPAGCWKLSGRSPVQRFEVKL